jgi:hypothetical protein
MVTSVGLEAEGSKPSNFCRPDHKPTEVTGIIFVGYGQLTEVIYFYFILK